MDWNVPLQEQTLAIVLNESTLLIYTSLNMEKVHKYNCNIIIIIYNTLIKFIIV